MIGRTISHYRIVEKLGEGGMGVVYRADDTMLGRQVALKFLRPGESSGDDSSDRLLREARIAASLEHPNICTIFEVGQVPSNEEHPGDTSIRSGSPFIAMELARGDTLREQLMRSGPLALDTLVRIALQVADGLAAAHALKIVHRDLKPQNVIVSSDDHVTILDFGLAKAFDPAPAVSELTTHISASGELSGESKVMGTVAYMSPEQALGKSLDSRSDIFSFGIMVYEMAVGRRPFEGETVRSTIAKILEAEPLPLGGVRPGLPRDIERVVHRCLQKNPGQRYNDTRDLVVDLREIQTAIATRTASSTDRPAAHGDREPWAADARRHGRNALALLGVLSIAGIIALRLGVLDRRPPPVPTHHQVTFSGTVTSPSISPDGQFIAHVTTEKPNELMVQDVAGGQAVKILKAEWLGRPRWSPDGTKLLVSAVGVSGDANVNGNYLVPRLGGDARRLPFTNAFSWSPDGTRYAGLYSAQAMMFFTNVATAKTDHVALKIPFVFLSDIDWSPNGDWLLISTVDRQERTSLWTITPDGTTPHNILESNAAVSSPEWSADGSGIYYLKGDRFKELWRIPVSPSTGERIGEPVVVLSALEAGSSFTFSRDGKRLAYSLQAVESNLWLAELPGREPQAGIHQLTTGTSAHMAPAVSPDGTRLAFARSDGRKSNIFVMPMSGGDPKQITFFDDISTSPAWSPEGERLAFGSLEGGVPRVWTVNAAGGEAQPFTKTRLSGSMAVSWFPDSKILYQLSGNRMLQVLDPRTEHETPLLQDSLGWMFRAAFSPDGRQLAVMWNRTGKAELWLITIGESAPGQSRLLTRDSYSPVGWSADGRLVYAQDGESIVAISSAGGIARTVLSGWPEKLKLGDASIAPDGRRAVLSLYRVRSDAWIADNIASGRE